MESTSASSVQRSFKYDVFLSFRGEDTRKNFVDHLYHALQQRGIMAYKDDERIEKGERIDDQLLRSIEDSRYHIIVFSKNYASSSWCLDELVKIMECQKTNEQTAYPIFYDVEPTEIRNQSGAVGLAFAKHEKRNRNFALSLIDRLFAIVASCCSGPSSALSGFTRLSDMDLEDTGRWRRALNEAASLAGLELKNTLDGHEARFIEKVVHDISLKLHLINFSVDKKLVGMKTRINSIVSSLEIGFDEDVRMVGIKGMGGGGKTTLARAVFDALSIGFDGKSFVANVREVSKGSLSGLGKLQEQVLKDVLKDKSIDISSVFDGGNMMRNRMPSRKVLLVLDDVDDISQLEALAGDPTWFKPGSRIIITTRDERVLIAHGVNFTTNFTHNVSLLTEEEAISLLGKYAFGKEVPNQGYKDLSREVIGYAKGLPITIKILGSALCGKLKDEWKDTIERLKTIPEGKTLEILELSYSGLENDEREIFLDVACILKGRWKDEAIKILESVGYHAKHGLKVLEEKSMINVSSIGHLLMHDLIEEMARNIVRREYPDEPQRHSRLWINEEIEDILVNESGTEETRSIRLLLTKHHPTMIMQGLRKMKKLRLLHVFSKIYPGVLDEVELYLPNALRTLSWSYYCFRHLPKTFQGDNLVNLDMSCSKICQVWEGRERKVLKSLRFLTLSSSYNLRTFDLSLTPNLEELDLRRCYEFVELHTPIECSKLKLLNLSDSKVSNLNLGQTPNLERLNLYNCKELSELHLPVECPKLEYLNLSYSKLTNFNLGLTPNLKMLSLEGCQRLLHLPEDIGKLECLKELDLEGCSSIQGIPKSICMMKCLKKLDLSGCVQVQELPEEFGNLKKLKELNIEGAWIKHLPESIYQLEDLRIEGHKWQLELYGFKHIYGDKYCYIGDTKSESDKYSKIYKETQFTLRNFMGINLKRQLQLFLGDAPRVVSLLGPPP